MSALPPALRPWARQLALLPDDASAPLGRWLMRLSAAIGPVGATGEVVPGGEPEGYDGLTRRGPLERVLTTEWLWALEAPDELVRRAAMGELAFLQRSFRQPRRTRRSVVLLDAGPEQLGLPRLAQLAVLLTLARRAEAAGVTFAWAVLQHTPRAAPFEAVTEESLRAWCDARTLDAPRSSRLVEWREALALGSDELWLVGSSRLGQLPEARGAFRVEIGEPMSLGARVLHVDVRPPTRSAQRLVLELPAPELCVRLLRSPVQGRAPKPVTTGTRLRGFAYSGDGHRMVLFRDDGSVLAQIIPNSPNATTPKPRRLAPLPGETLLAAGWRGRGGLLLLTRTAKGELNLRGQLHSPCRELERVILKPSQADDLLPCAPGSNQLPGRVLPFRDTEGQEHVVVVDAKGRAFRTKSSPGEAALTLEPVGMGAVVASACAAREQAMLLTCQEEGWRPNTTWNLALLKWGRDGLRAPPLNVEGGPAFFGWSPALHQAAGPLIAVQALRDTWRVGFGQKLQPISVPKESRVVGVYVDATDDAPRLITLDAARRSFSRVGAEGRLERCADAAGRVVQAEVSHGMPVLSWRTEDGELVMWDLNTRQVLLRLTQELA
ncbi:hypothetical protein DRW03_15610 [Corallococcus sp. H22C18031201]|nr:hypothetical protein DRW03_15610 [Corallococcus sp. H22C18031201]